MRRNNVYYMNEKKANITVARVMVITIALLTLIYILNLAHIFIIDFDIMTETYIASVLLLLTPLLLNKVIGPEKRFLKYIYISITALFLFVITVTLSFHTLVVYAYPIALAGLYFRKKTTIYATIVTIISTTAAEFTGYHLNLLVDRNATSFQALVYFCVLPRLICLSSFAALLYLLTTRSDEMLSEQDMAATNLINLNSDIITVFATLVENRDENTGGHIKRTSRYVTLLAEELKGKPGFEEIDDDFIENIRQAAPMHDVGKISVPDSILKKPGKLTPEEFEIMKQHCSKGGLIITASFNHIGDRNYRKMTSDVATFHHERWDGSGYPNGMKGKIIPLSARIMAVADVFDAVSQNRCYRSALEFDQCFNIIQEGAGKSFDPDIVKAFLKHRSEIEQICLEVRDQ